MTVLTGRRVRGLLAGWLAIELAAGIIAIAIVVALVPLVAILLSEPRHPLLAVVTVLSVSVPVAVVLGASALKMSWELLRQARAG